MHEVPVAHLRRSGGQSSCALQLQSSPASILKGLLQIRSSSMTFLYSPYTSIPPIPILEAPMLQTHTRVPRPCMLERDSLFVDGSTSQYNDVVIERCSKNGDICINIV